MGFKYKKSALKQILLMPSKQRTKSSKNNLLAENDARGCCYLFRKDDKKITTKNYLKYFIAGTIAGLCFALIFIISFSKIFSFYNPKYSHHRLSNTTELHFGSHFHNNENTTIADELFKEVRVLCWIMTNPDNHEVRAQHVKNTWGSRCNKLLFMSSTEDKKLGTVALPVSEGREELWAKTKEAFKYVYEHHLDEYDWFLKADDDTYVIVENLRKMLYAYSPEFPIYLGCKFNLIVKQGYMHGGAGYVLSKEALKRFIEKGLHNATICRQDDGGMEDVEIANCMEKLEVLAGDSREEDERARMFQFAPIEQLIPEHMGPWYWSFFWYKSDQGRFNCCADHAISFHYIKPNQMYMLDYFIYHVRPFGITYADDVLPDKKSLDTIITALSVPSINNRTT